ncbi:MAG: sigma-54 dependent transcriptional regulator [Candidatus Kapabacteria bacterium]|nr:sigma-54 dependent transcriptional regulator [Candidatus Kapabacteria bacterium]
MRVLIVDDNVDFATTIAEIVESNGFQTQVVSNPTDAISRVERFFKQISLILLDIEFGPDEQYDGLDLLEIFRRNHPYIPVVMISGKGTIESAVRATKLGAVNFIEKSTISKEQIKQVLQSSIYTESAPEIEEIRRFLETHGLMGRSKALLDVGDSIIRYGRTDLNVLITGETGTGKKLAAKAIHAISRRGKHPFITVDIPNIPRELFQSELFGHIKGSFSGATDTKRGLFHEANKGTLFLDEIGEMTLDLQSNLFIPIEEKVVRKVGSVNSEEVDIRFISATDKDLVLAMRESRFREQLYHRLRECEINMPNLAQRQEDVPNIAEFYIQKHNEDYSETKFLSPSALEFLAEQKWPGNVRELASVIRVAMQTTRTEKVEVNDLYKIINSGMKSHHNSETPEQFITGNSTLKEDIAQVDKRKIEATLEKNNGNVSKSAAALAISRETLHNKIRKYGINVQIFRVRSNKK